MFIFMLGFIFGGFFGMFLICMVQVCRADRDVKTAREYREEIRIFRQHAIGTIEKEKYIGKNEKYIAGMEDVVNMYEKYFEEDL